MDGAGNRSSHRCDRVGVATKAHREANRLLERGVGERCVNRSADRLAGIGGASEPRVHLTLPRPRGKQLGDVSQTLGQLAGSRALATSRMSWSRSAAVIAAA